MVQPPGAGAPVRSAACMGTSGLIYVYLYVRCFLGIHRFGGMWVYCNACAVTASNGHCMTDYLFFSFLRPFASHLTAIFLIMWVHAAGDLATPHRLLAVRVFVSFTSPRLALASSSSHWNVHVCGSWSDKKRCKLHCLAEAP